MSYSRHCTALTVFALSSALLAGCGMDGNQAIPAPSLTAITTSPLGDPQNGSQKPSSLTSSRTTASKTTSSTGPTSAVDSRSIEPVTDGVTTIGDLQGGMVPRYAGQIVRDGSTVTWQEGEKLNVGWIVSSPTVRDLGNCATEITVESADGGFSKSDWTATINCNRPQGYFRFALDRIGEYTVTFKISSKELELRQEIAFTVID